MKSREHVTNNGRAVFFAAMWNDLRQAALDKGWALALHGSLANDMDIMAMPWIDGAAHVEDMIDALKECFTEAECINVTRGIMPNNRRVYTLSIWADFYLDINMIHAQETTQLENENAAANKRIDELTAKNLKLLNENNDLWDKVNNPKMKV